MWKAWLGVRDRASAVVVSPLPPCLEGEPYLCIGDHPLELRSKFTNREGRELNRALKVAGFAEYTVVHETQIVKVPDSIPIVSAALLACGVITGLGAVVNTAHFRFGRSVAVVECGRGWSQPVQGASCGVAVRSSDRHRTGKLTWPALWATQCMRGDRTRHSRDGSFSGGATTFFVGAALPVCGRRLDMICKGGRVIQVGIAPLYTVSLTPSALYGQVP